MNSRKNSYFQVLAKYKGYLLLLLAALLVCTTLLLVNYLGKVAFYNPSFVTINLSNNTRKGDIEVLGITPFNKINKLTKDSHGNNWQSWYGFLSSIKIISPRS